MNLLTVKKPASFVACALAKEKKAELVAGGPELKPLEEEIKKYSACH